MFLGMQAFFKKQLHYELELKYNVRVNNKKKKLPNKLDHRNFYEFGHQQEQIVLLSSLNC